MSTNNNNTQRIRNRTSERSERVRFFDTKTRIESAFHVVLLLLCTSFLVILWTFSLELYFAFLLFLDYEADNEAKAMFGDSEEDGKGNWQSFLLCQLIVVG